MTYRGAGVPPAIKEKKFTTENTEGTEKVTEEEQKLLLLLYDSSVTSVFSVVNFFS